MSSAPESVPQGSFVVLWAGEDPVLHDALLEQLDTAEIPYADKNFGEDEVAPTADPLPIDWKPRFGFEVAVLSTDFEEARALLEPLLDREPAEFELQESDADVAGGEKSKPGTMEAPTLLLASSEDSRFVKFLTDALRENGIPLRTKMNGSLTEILVPPSCEARAQEILREVREGAPPA
jgi:hypothetical protein